MNNQLCEKCGNPDCPISVSRTTGWASSIPPYCSKEFPSQQIGHSQSKEIERCKNMLYYGNPVNRPMGYCNNPLPCPTCPKEIGWTEGMSEVGAILADFEDDRNEVKAVNTIFALFSSLLATQKDGLKKRIGEMRGGFMDEVTDDGYNQAITDILALLEE